MIDGGKFCYPGTNILINKYGIKEKKLLDQMEIQKFYLQSIKLQLNPNLIKATFDKKHLIDINSFLFGNIYDWAGTYRKEDLYKSERILSGGSAQYCPYDKIEIQLKLFFEKYNDVNWKLKENLVENTTELLSELWHIHPFREGNTRTCTCYTWHFLEAKDVKFDIELLKNNANYVRDSLVSANYGKKEYLEKIIKGALNENKEKISLEEHLSRFSEQYQINKEKHINFKERYSIEMER